MSLTAARPAGGDKPRPYILRVSGDRKYVVGAAFMAAPTTYFRSPETRRM